jgi:hypothetical protein
MSKLLTFIAVLLATVSIFSQELIDLPPIEGEPHDNAAPEGWGIYQESPDIINGNGPWPGATYHVENVNGGNVDGKTMGLFLANQGGIQEGWSLPLSNLKVGKQYEIRIQWQQATLTDYASVTYKGGDLELSVDGVSKVFTSNAGVNDTWQKASIVFTATAQKVEFNMHVSESANGVDENYGSAIVVDSDCRVCREAAAPY